MEKIPCGGFYIDDRVFYFKNQNGKPILCASEDAIRGVQGAKGDKGDPFTIDKIYSSISEMEADHDNELIPMGSFVLIENEDNPQDTDNGKLYIKDVHGFDYVTNLSGAQGLKGEKGDTGNGVPSAGHKGQLLVKSSDEDYATHWETLGTLPVVDEEDEGKIAVVVDGEWNAGYIEYGKIVHATGSRQLNGYAIPTFDENQMEDIYNTFTAGQNAIISDTTGAKHYKVLSVNASDGQNITAKILFEDDFIVTYNKLGQVASFVPIVEGQVVEYSREYATAPNDHGYVREWTPNAQGKVWVECGVFITTVALSVGSRVPLPVTFEDGNFHVQVTVLELGNYAATAYRSGDNRSINVRVHDYYGTPKAVKICVEAKGWKA